MVTCNVDYRAGHWLTQSVPIILTVVKINQYTGLQQYTGRAKRVRLGTGWLSQYRLYCGKNQSGYWTTAVYWSSEASNAERSSANSLSPARKGAPLEAAGGQKNMHSCFILHDNRGSKLYWPGVVAVIHRKNQQKVKKNTCNVWRWCDILHVTGVGAGAS